MNKKILLNKLGRLYNTKIDRIDPRGEMFSICEKCYQEVEEKWSKNGLIFLEEGKTNKSCQNCGQS